MNFDIWKMLATQGDQQNPAVFGQMAKQAQPMPAGWRAPMLPPQAAPEAPQMPELNPNMAAAPEQAAPAAAETASPAPQTGPTPQLDYANALLKAYRPQPVSPEELNQRRNMDTTFGEYIAKQQGAANDLKGMLDKYHNKEDRFDFRPLAAFVDAQTGSKFTGVAEQMAPESDEQKLKTETDLKKAIGQAQAGITKEQYDYIKAKLVQAGYDASRMTKKEVAEMAAAAKLAGVEQQGKNAGIRNDQRTQSLELQKQRLGNQIEKEARSKVDQDPMLKIFTPRLEGAAKIGELLTSAREGKVVSNQALLGQVNAEIARLETGSQSPGLHSSEKTELNDYVAQLKAVRDSVTGNPEDSVRPEVLNTAGKLVNELSQSYMKGIDSRMKLLSAGMRPEQQKIVSEKHAVLKSTYGPRMGGWKGLGPQPGDTDDGHVFLGGDPADPKNWKAQ